MKILIIKFFLSFCASFLFFFVFFFLFLLFCLLKNESFGDVKQRLQTKLGLANREFEKVIHYFRILMFYLEFQYRFSIFNGSKVISRCDDNQGKINVNELKLVQSNFINVYRIDRLFFFYSGTCWLGLELPSTSNPRKTRKSLFSEKPIRINQSCIVFFFYFLTHLFNVLILLLFQRRNFFSLFDLANFYVQIYLSDAAYDERYPCAFSFLFFGLNRNVFFLLFCSFFFLV